MTSELLSQARTALSKNPPQHSEYLRLLRQAAEEGDVEAMENLAAWYLEGFRDERGRVLLKRSPRSAVPLLQRAANASHPEALHALGYCYDVGLGVRKDKQKALALYRRAARAGVMISPMNIAILYRERGDKKSEKRWLARAAEAGDPDARLALAESVLSGRSSTRRKALAVRDLELLTRQTNDSEYLAKAMAALVNAHERGIGVPKSERKAAAWRTKAARLPSSRDST